MGSFSHSGRRPRSFRRGLAALAHWFMSSGAALSYSFMVRRAALAYPFRGAVRCAWRLVLKPLGASRSAS